MAATADFDPDLFAALVGAAVDSFDFTLPGDAGETLGRDLAAQASIGMSQRTADGKDVNGQPFRPNAKKWAAYKARRYSVMLPGELGGQMNSLASLLGRPEVTPDRIVLVYGLQIPPTRTSSRSGVALKPRELVPTDEQKAAWFEAGGRHFWGLDQAIIDELTVMCGDAFGRHMAAVLG